MNMSSARYELPVECMSPSVSNSVTYHYSAAARCNHVAMMQSVVCQSVAIHMRPTRVRHAHTNATRTHTINVTRLKTRSHHQRDTLKDTFTTPTRHAKHARDTNTTH